MNRSIYLLTLLCLFVLSCNRPSEIKEDVWLISAPAKNEYCKIDFKGATIIPNGRIIRPLGITHQIAPHPYGLALSHDGRTAITSNSGTIPFSISILRQVTSSEIDIQQVPEGAKNDEGLLEAVFMGVAFTPDDSLVYIGGGQSNKIFIMEVSTGKKVGEISCGVNANDHGYIGDLRLTRDGKTLYAVDQIGFTLLKVDTKTKKVVHRIAVGRYPFGLVFSPDERNLYVANVGAFEYSSIQSLDPDDLKGTAPDYPVYAYNSETSKQGIDSDTLKVAPLGDVNVPESFSVWTVSLVNPQPVVTAKIKTGFLVGEKIDGIPAVGGSSPNSLVATDKYVFISNGNNDCISVLDIEKDTVIMNINLQPDERLGYFKGVIPFGLAISPDQKRLYVAESGINAVGVIDIPSKKVIGHLPVGWFPSKLAVSPDGKKLIVANAKGYGSGPNGGKDYVKGPEGTYIGALMKGSVTVLDIPPDVELSGLSSQVIANNFTFKKYDEQPPENPIPAFPLAKDSPIRHIVFISKENRTYDEVFGQVKGGKGDPTIARYGANQSFKNKLGTDSVSDATIMVNHLALANRFSISDNFYVDADHSADGHRWLVNTYPNEWVETHVSATYGGKRGMRRDSKAPGNYGLVGASGAIYPEDYNQHGSIWDHFDRNGIDFFNFGFGAELAGTINDSTMKYVGVKYLVNFPLPAPLFDNTSKQYATYNMAIPDQFRVDTFIDEFNEKWGVGKDTLPSVLTIILPNDHGAEDRPRAGYPFRESYMADNDLALGRLIEFLSHTPYWKKMAIFVTEDDSQDGVDHIDAHRSLLMVISPYSKKNFVSHVHSSFGSIFKTFWNILGIPFLNHYDAGATDLSDMFTSEPDFTPYNAFAVDKRVLDPQKLLDPFDEEFDWSAIMESPELDNVEDFIQDHKERR